jgi:hypothetical protein
MPALPPSGGASALPADVETVLDEVLGTEEGWSGDDPLDRLVDGISPSGLIDVDPECACCTGHGQSPWAEPEFERGYCQTKLAGIVEEWQERRAAMKDEPR